MILPWVRVQCDHPDCEEWFDTFYVPRWHRGRRVKRLQHTRCAGHRRRR